MEENKAKNNAQATSAPASLLTSASTVSAGLYLVATPIGNLRDITLRALDVLKAADIIACEDTRTSAKLLQAYGILTRTVAYHEHNAAKARPALLQALQSGKIVALISDAGTPLISDPGYKLVEEAVDLALNITPIPGACAAITGLCAAGLPTDHFYFAGFLPSKSSARKTALEALNNTSATLIFYESPRRIAETLRDAAEMLGERAAVVGRELTKKFEEFRRGSLQELADYYGEAETPKGEIVLMIGAKKQSAEQYNEADIDRLLLDALAHHSVKQASAEVAEITGQPKRTLYQRALQLKVE